MLVQVYCLCFDMIIIRIRISIIIPYIYKAIF